MMNANVATVSQGRKNLGQFIKPVKPLKKEAWAVFEYAGKEGWRRSAQGIWFFEKEYSESQLKALKRVYPWRLFTLRSSRESTGH